ncbi:MAG: 4-aminobutyrate aminotransferase [Rhodobacteraceae bacterium]|uniref:aspartate aminotransferase family protein n=1 Tax=Cypionkella sp. TaxID=2811411 RepID=UPI0013228AD5|nr:aminotransferase class III-fold pyridoxal phosphate-dependent enzyme [Cypionkella sp.]KAF0172408.1 MAG: 4-aminobutyrate aminotransferase [Paracoccaceae bacterium]MDO8327570.1 aminotransferase class III-fold pyridoxal phosphate-dependent enzyme [Cypionkella sp.]
MPETLLDRRTRLLGPNVRLFYHDPLHLVRGKGTWVWDAAGRRYLDCYNNVPHVGHCHPHVVEAITRQAQTLNTHTRYLHENILDYVERLTATFGPQITSAILTCTGSEANDVALRMAQAATGATGIIATDHTYHGNTAAVSQLSTTMPPIGGFGGHVRHVPAPDSYRPLGGSPQTHATAFAAAVEAACQSLIASGHGVSGLILCPAFVNEGFPDLAHGFLTEAIAIVRRHGGVIIADEVQPGFGRTGPQFWGHVGAGFAPDIVTMGKPMGNGHPVAAVATSFEIISAFRRAFRYFNTFGGNPVSCAAAAAVLDVLKAENLPARAAETGAYLRDGLRKLAEKHSVIGDVRGQGLAIGAELVSDRASKAPATELADRVINAMRAEGVLMGANGIHYNVLKIRPPMPFGKVEADIVLQTLDKVLDGL